MTLANCHEDIVSYHNDDVTLPKAEQDAMRERRDAGRTRLKGGLEKDKNPSPSEFASQGSYSMRTMVQDPESDYDIDDGVYFRYRDLLSDGSAMEPAQVRQMVWKALQHDERLKEKAKIRPNCVRQDYPEGYHIDIPVYRERPNDQAHFELASGDSWTAADGRAVTTWFNGIVGALNSGEMDGNQLRRVVKLTKKYARSRSAWKKQVTSGICITKLVVDNFVPHENRDDSALYSVWTKIRNYLHQSLRVNHPVIAGTTVSKGDNDSEVAFFRDKLNEAVQTLAPLLNESCARTDALSCWDKVFNTSYFSRRGPKGGTGGKGGPPFVKTSEKVTTRDDGDRRFGW